MATMAVGAVVVGCGSSGSGGSGGSATEPSAVRADQSSSPTAATAEKLAADSGVRYGGIGVPEAIEGLVCDEGDGGFRFGSDLDIRVSSDDGLKELEGGEDVADEVSCFGSPRIILRKGTMAASAPVFTARTNLYEQVADPAASLNTIFERTVRLEEGYGRNFTGEPRTFTSPTLVVTCQQNVTDTFPMTTCFWANYGAAGVLDFFPPDGQRVPIESAVRLTKDFVVGALKAKTGS
ncbi:hypothetical protein [Streptomyces sp. NBC_01353]|uniref:hypothetical protein n=1 Tax=Streptomyces sp. NBC_01353 TaxID=2903835 RepID=UPI002E364E21|nr:hypothetical protein [Streptomyces sp. NBC_01353]